MSNRAVIALGSNIGDAAATLKEAVEKIGRIAGVTVTKTSSIHNSEPAYLEDQAIFSNAVLLAQVELAPLDLLHELQAIEQQMGRIRTIPNGPRTLDLDIVDYEGVVSEIPELLLPHPLALERDFVVTPLLEIAPHYTLANGIPVTRDAIKYGKVVGYPPPSVTLSAAKGPEGDRGTATDVAGVPQSTPSGILSICATPIGNLGDITLRVIEAFKQADLILAEDTRVTRKLLNHLGITTKLERCDENVIRQRSPQIIERIKQGSRVAYVSDAGTPTVADPGAYLIAAAHEAHCPVEVLPGASAVLTAVVASGFSAASFHFGGFLPRKKQQIIATLTQLSQLDASLVFYESPHRTAASLALIAELFPEREVVLARELTKFYEEILRAPAPALAAQIAEREQNGQALKGEVVLVIGPPPKQAEKRTHQDKYAPSRP
jgi:16S rRNA (cytidine1402-2'-O)-methyltransferase